MAGLARGRWSGWAAVALAFALTTFAIAQQPGNGAKISPPRPDLGDLHQRLEKLERQNDELTRSLETLRDREPSGTPSPVKLLAPNPAKTDAPKADAAGKAPTAGANLKMDAVWKNGLSFQSADKAFKFSIGGTVQFDMGWYGAGQNIVNSIGLMNNYADPGLALSDGMDFRRARIRMNGSVYETIEYFAQYDFAQSIDLRRRTLGVTNPTALTAGDNTPAEGTQFNEVWIGLTQLPHIGAIRIGHHREALNFVTATADRNVIWMERGLLFDAFNGDFNFGSGVTIDRTYLNDRAYSWLGFFQNNSRTFTAIGDGDYAYDARLTALPVWDEDAELWVHVGVDYSYRNLSQNQVRFRARPMVRVGNGFQVPNILDTGVIFSNDAQQIANLEFAAAYGRWTFASEAACSWVTNAFTGGLPLANGKLPPGAAARGTFSGTAAYTELLYFLTPDHRNYRKERPGYDRVVPRENFIYANGEHGSICSRGAWEVGVRYDALDLTDSGINGGTGQAITFALNWYLNPNARMQWNYFVMHRGFVPGDTAARVSGDLQGLGFRVNMDF